MTDSIEVNLRLPCTCGVHEDGDKWVASCPPLNVCADAPTSAGAREALRRAAVAFLEECLEGDVLPIHVLAGLVTNQRQRLLVNVAIRTIARQELARALQVHLAATGPGDGGALDSLMASPETATAGSGKGDRHDGCVTSSSSARQVDGQARRRKGVVS